MIENLFQLILFFLSGYFSRKFKIFSETASEVLIKFIIYISLPALVIYNVYSLKLEKNVFLIVISGWFVIFFSICISFFIGKLLNLERKTLSTFVIMATFGNTSFLGIPFQKALLGEEAIKYAIIFDQLASFIPVIVLSPLIISYGSLTKVKIDIKKIITFPPFIALFSGFILSNFYIPEFIIKAFKELGMTVIPIALFSIGMNLRFSNVLRDLKEVSIILFIKMLAVPIVFITVLKISGIEFLVFWKSIILEIAMPPMVLASILIINAKLNKDIAVSSVGMGIILSFITVPIVFYIMRVL